MNSLTETINLATANIQFCDKLINETPERNELNIQAFKLAQEIVKLPNVEKFEDRYNFKDQKIWFKYLSDIPARLQIILEKAYILNNNECNLSKAQILNNFIRMCFFENMAFTNPFNLFTLITSHYDGLLRNRFSICL